MKTRQRKGEWALHFERVQCKDRHENDIVQCLSLPAHKTSDTLQQNGTRTTSLQTARDRPGHQTAPPYAAKMKLLSCMDMPQYCTSEAWCTCNTCANALGGKATRLTKRGTIHTRAKKKKMQPLCFYFVLELLTKMKSLYRKGSKERNHPQKE